MTTKIPDNEQYRLTQAEQRYIERLRQLQSKAATSTTPQLLTVIATRSTLAYFDGKPSGKDSSENDRD